MSQGHSDSSQLGDSHVFLHIRVQKTSEGPVLERMPTRCP